VQGLGHDLTTIARVSLYKRIKNIDALAQNIRFISTVHDSIVLDFHGDFLQAVSSIVDSVALDLPNNFNKLFNSTFNLPVKFEITIGNNLLDMQPIV
jgi:DNA polymerase I-like protein with 3'-5' exonuclease and polymerase domains